MFQKLTCHNLMVVFALCLVFTLASATTSSAETPSESGQEAVAPPQLMGVWLVTSETPGMPAFRSLFTFSLYGMMLGSQAFVVPTPYGTQIFSTTHGEWKRISNNRFSFGFIVLLHSDTGVYLGTSKVKGTVELDDNGSVMTGTASAVDLDPDGRVTFSFESTLKGRRVTFD